MKESSVAVLSTLPFTVKDDYSYLLDLISADKLLHDKVILKLNLSWTKFFPACSSPPWQVDGVLKFLNSHGLGDIVAVENQTVVTHPWKGAYYNKWLPLLEKYNVPYIPLTDVQWVHFKPRTELLVLEDLFKNLKVPKLFINSSIIHLPTMKTHGHTVTTGAIKNAFGGLIPKYRHHAHKKIHEVLVDLLALQKELHKSCLAVMDGTVCGNGAGPRTMTPMEGNVLLASYDQVAIDAVAASIMGFNPFKIPYIKMAHDRGLGNGDLSSLDLIGLPKQKVLKMNLGFKTSKSAVVYWDQIIRNKTSRFNNLHRILFHSPVFRLFILASNVYHDTYWYNSFGRYRIACFKQTQWGRLFDSYDYGRFPKHLKLKTWDNY